MFQNNAFCFKFQSFENDEFEFSKTMNLNFVFSRTMNLNFGFSNTMNLNFRKQWIWIYKSNKFEFKIQIFFEFLQP